MNEALQVVNMAGVDVIDSGMAFEEEDQNNGDIADLANLQPALKKSQTQMNNPGLLNTFSQINGQELQMKKATSAQIVRP